MSQKTLGQRLMYLAKHNALSAITIAAYTGASRATVYNWYEGKGISPAYRGRVLQLIDTLNKKETK